MLVILSIDNLKYLSKDLSALTPRCLDYSVSYNYFPNVNLILRVKFFSNYRYDIEFFSTVSIRPQLRRYLPGFQTVYIPGWLSIGHSVAFWYQCVARGSWCGGAIHFSFSSFQPQYGSMALRQAWRLWCLAQWSAGIRITPVLVPR